MTVKELKELLADAPDDMRVLLPIEDHLKPGMFAFAEACTCETGISTLGNEDGTADTDQVFLVLPHGFGVSEKETDDDTETIPELN